MLNIQIPACQALSTETEGLPGGLEICEGMWGSSFGQVPAWLGNSKQEATFYRLLKNVKYCHKAFCYGCQSWGNIGDIGLDKLPCHIEEEKISVKCYETWKYSHAIDLKTSNIHCHLIVILIIQWIGLMRYFRQQSW